MHSITWGRMRVRSASWSTERPMRRRAAARFGPMIGSAAGWAAKSSMTSGSTDSRMRAIGRTRSPQVTFSSTRSTLPGRRSWRPSTGSVASGTSAAAARLARTSARLPMRAAQRCRGRRRGHDRRAASTAQPPRRDVVPHARRTLRLALSAGLGTSLHPAGHAWRWRGPGSDAGRDAQRAGRGLSVGLDDLDGLHGCGVRAGHQLDDAGTATSELAQRRGEVLGRVAGDPRGQAERQRERRAVEQPR
jgi:hypothetical protein